jgi:hypothetical protein
MVSSLNRRGPYPSSRYVLWYCMALMVFGSNATFGTVLSPDGFTIRFGLMKKNASGQYRVYKETTQIPLVLSDPEFRFGFEVEHARPGNFTGYVVLHFPSAAQHVDGSVGQQNSPMVRTPNFNQKTFTTDKVSYDRFWGADFGFDNDNDVGDYSFDIFLNDTLVRTVHFEVTRPRR